MAAKSMTGEVRGNASEGGGDEEDAVGPSEHSVPNSIESSRTGRRMADRKVVIVASGLAVILAAVLVAGLAFPSVTWPASRTSDDFTEATSLSFPGCTWVTATWHDTQNAPVVFAVGQAGEAALVSGCRAAGPELQGNCSCPPVVCPTNAPPRPRPAPGPECYQDATHGSVTFFATQPSYEFFAFLANGSENLSTDRDECHRCGPAHWIGWRAPPTARGGGRVGLGRHRRHGLERAPRTTSAKAPELVAPARLTPSGRGGT
jgi:hypothetical protein